MRGTLLLFTALLSGCTFARLDTSPRNGEAFIIVARLPGGNPAVAVHGINSKHRMLSQPLKDVRSFGVKPGTYLLDVDCFRPGASALVDGSFDFVFSVEANKRYVLDCTPKEEEAGNEFYLTEVGT